MRPARSVLRVVAAAVLLVAAAPPATAQVGGGAVDERVRRVETGLLTYHVVRGEPAGGLALEERLRHFKVPGVSVAVIDGGVLAWARAWGTTDAGGSAPVDTTTLFQAASISKPVAAVAAMRLAERGVVDLDADVNAMLRTWRVPANDHTASEKVTLRRLLSHSAGTTVHGFPGYAAGRPLPTLVQVLDGDGPANTAPVRVDGVPGTNWRYSGGGTSIAQLVLMDVTGSSFPELMRELVLAPAGMSRSTYEQPLPPARAAEAAAGHKGDGSPVAGRFHTYPEQAAAGLWTTPSDLARLAIEIQRALAGERGRVLSPGAANRMLTPVAGGFGVGFALDGEGDELRFSHGGANEGFRATFVAFARRGRGAVIMTNGDAGSDLAGEILRAIAREYGWPGFRPIERNVVSLDSETLAAYAGEYRFRIPGRPEPLDLSIAATADGLRATLPPIGWHGRALRPSGRDTFFFLETPGELAFERDNGGAVTGVVLTGLGAPIRGVRR